MNKLLIFVFLISLSACDKFGSEGWGGSDKKQATVDDQLKSVIVLIDQRNLGSAIELTSKIRQENPQNYEAYYLEAQAVTLMGNKTDAVSLLEVSMQRGFKNFSELKSNKNFSPLRDLSEYQALLSKYDPEYKSTTVSAGDVSIKETGGRQVIKAGDVTISLPND